MTPREIEKVRAAWEADPACQPVGRHASTVLRLPPPQPSDAEIERALHRRLLERGAWVELDGGLFTVTVAAKDGFRTGSESESLIECMADAIVALNTETKR